MSYLYLRKEGVERVQIEDLSFVPYIYAPRIRSLVSKLASRLNDKYRNVEKPVCVVAVLHGAIPFAADLIRKLSFPVILDTVQTSSYEGGTSSTGILNIKKWTSFNPEGQNILIVEDIVDTGKTTDYLKSEFLKQKAASVEICPFLLKKDVFLKSGHVESDTPTFYGTIIGNLFVLGYGMDYKERGRELRDIYILETKHES